MDTFSFGWFVGLIFWLVFSTFVSNPICVERGREELRNQAVEKGYGEYVIEEKEIVFKWKENQKQ